MMDDKDYKILYKRLHDYTIAKYLHKKFAVKSLRKQFAKKVVLKVFAQIEKNCQSVGSEQNTDLLYQLTDNVVNEVALKYMRFGERDEQNLGCTVLHYCHTTNIRGYLIAKRGIPFNDIDYETENVFVKFYKNIHLFRQDCLVSTWLARIADNVASDYWRDTQRYRKLQEQIVPQYPNGSKQNDEPETLVDEAIAIDTTNFENDFGDKRCLEQVKAQLESEGNTYLLECLEAHRLESEGFSKPEIGEKIGRTKDATKQFMVTCRKKLVQYQSIQECRGIFLKMCLENIKADLERDGFNDTEILNCLQVYLLKLLRQPTPKIANQIGKSSRETKAYFFDCKEKLMQHPAISKECREWLAYLE